MSDKERTMRFYASLGYEGAERREEFTFPAGTTEDHIKEAFDTWLSNCLDASYYYLDEDAND